MREEWAFKGTPEQFWNMVDNFMFSNLEDGRTGQPIYSPDPKNNADRVEIRFRNASIENRGAGGTILITSTVDPQISLLTMYTDDFYWGDVKEAWEALKQEMIRRKRIEPDSTKTNVEEKSASQQQTEAKIYVPKRQAERKKWDATWEAIEGSVDKGKLKPSELRNILKGAHNTRHLAEVSDDTLRAIIKAGLNGRLQFPTSS